MSFKKSLFKNILTLGGYNYSSQAANFLASIVLSRLLLPEEYGYVALITVFTGFVTIFADAGLSFAIIRSDYGYTFQRAITNLSFYFGLLLFLIMLILSYPIALFYNDMTLVIPTMVMALTFIAGAFRIAPMAVFSKELNFNYIGKVKLIANLVSIGLMILMASLGFSYWSLIIPLIVMNLLEYTLFEIKLKLGFRFYPWRYTVVAFRKTKSLITNLSGFNLINYWARNADNLIIGKFYSSYDLGIYNRAYKMLQLALNVITGLFGTVLYPSLKKFKSEGGDVNAEYMSILGVISIINFPIGLVLILFPETFVSVLWGKNWLMVAELLPYFGILIMFQTMISTTGHVFILLEEEKRFMKLGVTSAVILILAIISGAFYSMMMVAIAYAFSYMVFIVPLYLYFGYYKIFGYSGRQIIKFWLPKLVLGIALLLCVYFAMHAYLYALLGIYLIHLLYNQRSELLKLKEFTIRKLKKS